MVASTASLAPPCRSSLSFTSSSGRARAPPPRAVRCSAPSDIDAPPLLRAAKYTVDRYIKSGMVVGLGSGNASCMAIKYLGQQLRAGTLEDIVGVPTSVTSASEAAKSGIPLDDYQGCSQIDFAFDDADIIEEDTLIAVIGRRKLEGGESIIQEKFVLNAAKRIVFIITENKYKGALDGSVPVLVQSLNWMEIAEELDDLFLGDAEVWRRPSIGHADPFGGDFPVVTKDGHNVLDVIFTSPIANLAQVAESLDRVDRVVDHGIVSKFPCTAVVVSESGVSVIDSALTKVAGYPAL
ncbi:probable ribose-5-phosphate isomerase 4, chloroplastic isoform X1 [Eucalyptus grandis]|uniref:probable ribose-5-phosphate isomerase 4, chloroplastic isoform X1 n=1 Tax=Eucalyptus grandis TaxID=71139 RepID=UPI00192EA082|nr:probable ribose-5-phosphate isomerase 4, chloroplastic isoform X1 [Eucalyptus grandis]